MTKKFLTKSLILLSLVLSACTAVENREIDPDRRPLGKADSTGTCQDSDCDSQSTGSCFCDAACSEYGDCCEDYVEFCEAPGAFCGGFLGSACDESEYCHYDADIHCGIADGAGTCRQKPEVCIQLFAPVCGCDGNTYSNSCFAAVAGAGVMHEGECAGQGSECQPVLCELFCDNGFATDENGCEVCSCAE